MEITIKLMPNAQKNEISGWETSNTNEKVLKIRVTAIPEDGKANKALIALLSKEWKIPKSSIEIIRGETARTKTIFIPDLYSSPFN